jgi:hypothetical protein
MALAQTNLQLYRQARAAGYDNDAILILRKDYETACFLYAGGMRRSGKPLLCHVTGAASALIAENQDILLVRGLLNHAAYVLGRFPTGARGMRNDHRTWLRSRVGAEVEQLICDYAAYEFSPDTVERLANGALESLSGRDRDLLVMRLCNEVDDAADFAAALQRDPRWRDASYIENLKALCAVLDLAVCNAAFDAIAAEMNDAAWLSPDVITGFLGHRQSVLRYAKATLQDWRRALRG